jgi:hypothetical protein
MEPVKTERPMSEYESALFQAVLVIGHTLLKAGNINESELLSGLTEARTRAEEAGRTNEAATLGFLIKFLGEPPTYYVPGALPS